MSAVLDKPTTQEQAHEAVSFTGLQAFIETNAHDPATYSCSCEACSKKPIEVFGLTRVKLPDDETLITALMETRRFVLDETTPKVAGWLAARERRVEDGDFLPPIAGQTIIECMPCDEDATAWCAIGWLGKTLGENDAGAVCDTIAAEYEAPMVAWVWQSFDKGDYAHCAAVLEALAMHIATSVHWREVSDGAPAQ